MAKGDPSVPRIHRKGQPRHWNHYCNAPGPGFIHGVLETEFEKFCSQRGVPLDRAGADPEVKQWVLANCNRRYVPETVLKQCGIDPRFLSLEF
jgi:hypothetical protein